ncbi:hypothetical protein ACWDAO_32160 [Streptomyces sp. NPDC001212]|uniref:hypothetical protein n=1 Tax=Streptomyces sp. CoT10 TaxID=2875762 RepID=UPI001CD544C4|nr:hypothetical protein [Streptomyces sp. CoT10]
MLDAVLSPEWEWRYYSFDSGWSPGEEMASMRDGAGNDYAIVFSAAGVYAQACDHESQFAVPGAQPPAFTPSPLQPGAALGAAVLDLDSGQPLDHLGVV